MQRSGRGRCGQDASPDLRIIDLQSKRVFYLDPKLSVAGNRGQQFPHILFRAEEVAPIKCAGGRRGTFRRWT